MYLFLISGCKVLYLFELAKLSNHAVVKDVDDIVLYLFELAKLSNVDPQVMADMVVLYLFELAKLSNYKDQLKYSYGFCIFLN